MINICSILQPSDPVIIIGGIARHTRYEAIQALDGGRCRRCGRRDDFDLLDVDHIDGEGWLDRQEKSSFEIFKAIITNPEASRSRYQVLCVRCHAIKTRREDAKRRMKTKYPPPEDFSDGWKEREGYWFEHPENGPLQRWFDEWKEEQIRLQLVANGPGSGINKALIRSWPGSKRREHFAEVCCPKCGVTKRGDGGDGLGGFYVDDWRGTGWSSRCKECVKKGKSG